MSDGVDFMMQGTTFGGRDDFHQVLSGDYPVIRPINYPVDLQVKDMVK
jgi:calcineurin-like phosphoesterase